MPIPDRPVGADAFFEHSHDEEMHVHLSCAADLGIFQRDVVEAAVTLAMYVEIPAVDVTVFFEPVHADGRPEHGHVVFPKLLDSYASRDGGEREAARNMINAYTPRLAAIAMRARDSGLKLAAELGYGYPPVSTPVPCRRGPSKVGDDR